MGDVVPEVGHEIQIRVASFLELDVEDGLEGVHEGLSFACESCSFHFLPAGLTIGFLNLIFPKYMLVWCFPQDLCRMTASSNTLAVAADLQNVKGAFSVLCWVIGRAL